MYFGSVILISSGIDCNDATRFDFNRQLVVWGEHTNYFGNTADFFIYFKARLEISQTLLKKPKPYLSSLTEIIFLLTGKLNVK